MEDLASVPSKTGATVRTTTTTTLDPSARRVCMIPTHDENRDDLSTLVVGTRASPLLDLVPTAAADPDPQI